MTDVARDPAAPPAAGRGPRVVALGGGHGLHATIGALRLLTEQLTAVVTVADDGGSSGRIRRELPVLPPGDLRMALCALAGDSAENRYWSELLQHRLGGGGALTGHPVGNLLMTGMFDLDGDPLAGLDRMAGLVGAVGRVLPMSLSPLDLIGEVDRFDPADPDRVREIRGQSSIAVTPGRVRSVRVQPIGAPACAAAVDAIREADLVVLGPGSWFTSVLPHLLLRELGLAIARTGGTVVVVLNLVPQAGETDDYAPRDLLRILVEHAEPLGGLPVGAVIADEDAVVDRVELADFASTIGARLVVSRLAASNGSDRHDPQRLAAAFRQALEDPVDGEGTDIWR